ncbi:hypothetical protein GCM10009547_45650 [Sporichthya brevicatena]|uniref:DUF6884 domain-containing protein n=1 Tax=Sporichthya brevicatena TaxID=171442 RepID=A0ABN1HB27_9ACTN
MAARHVILIGCVQTKLDSPAPAADLFTSPLFKARRAYAERSRRRWFVLSSRYGVLPPDRVVAPYDLPQARQPVDERNSWAEMVLAQLQTELGGLKGRVLEVHAGSAYVDPIASSLTDLGATVLAPLRGLALGQHLAWYAAQAPAPRTPRRRVRT